MFLIDYTILFNINLFNIVLCYCECFDGEADSKGQNNSLRIEYSETRSRLTSSKNKKKGLD